MNTASHSAPHDDPVLREALKRCSPSTYYAACKFRQTRAPDDLRTLVTGVIERFVERDRRAALAAGPATLRLREDLGLDSLTMMEIVMLAEEVLPLTVANDELTQLRTLGDVHDFIARKVAVAPGTSRPATPVATESWDIAAVGESIRQLEANAATSALQRGAH
ncbi:MAG: acyl carrier protein [Opitutaceae bacterium]|nr:acyl carrier protein [Opitutaceae bacterium]